MCIREKVCVCLLLACVPPTPFKTGLLPIYFPAGVTALANDVHTVRRVRHCILTQTRAIGAAPATAAGNNTAAASSTVITCLC